MIQTIDLNWRNDHRGFAPACPAGEVTPIVGHVGSPYAGIWRFRRLGGGLSELLNLIRAKGAATSIAFGTINGRKDCRETPSGAPLVRLNEAALR